MPNLKHNLSTPESDVVHNCAGGQLDPIFGAAWISIGYWRGGQIVVQA
jgi:hypothetical protein